MDPRFSQAIELFNRREYFDCQEYFERVWQESEAADKRLLESLMQLAVALHLFFNRGGGKGTTGLLQRCLLGLDEYESPHLGIDLTSLAAEVSVYLEDLKASDARAPRLFERWRVPKIKLV
jgi:uncharacterized protein